DPASTNYNMILDRAQIHTPDWHSAERLARADGRYTLGLVIEHNAENPVANAGSCTFIHLASRPAHPHPGRMALHQPPLQGPLTWLDPDAKPTLVALPTAEARRLRAAWGLPEVSPPRRTK